ncbi:GNAT family N-acetyltransferase [Exiguobacterium qingdaonense]|uniref:GNAT family N-acetyltransferase n=1 Tax=Exiguobacterium qingdaonense TaxID=2751251 RepID=UPI001BE80D2B|nr:GNAT family N-acetyltransferase [Exiguobacterium qingdaonense]
MEFRSLEQSDVKSLQRLFMESLSDLIRREHFEDADLLDEEVARLNTTIQDHFDDDQVQLYVIEQEGVIIGAGALLPPNEIITGHMELERGAVELGSVYVSPRMQRQGVGRFLLEEMKREMRARHLQFIYLDAGFPSAQAYWKKRLGNPSLVLEHYWGPGASHMIWKVDIKQGT